MPGQNADTPDDVARQIEQAGQLEQPGQGPAVLLPPAMMQQQGSPVGALVGALLGGLVGSGVRSNRSAAEAANSSS